MAKQPNQTDQLLEKLEMLQKKQDMVSSEIYQLRKELILLKMEEAQQKLPDQPVTAGNAKGEVKAAQKPAEPAIWRPTGSQADDSAGKSSNLEKFIGENLINKIGIGITIIGVSIGVKYSIDHDLISPVTRILLGYLAGTILLILGIRLKKDYENYSAVLVSGSMAILYFITYAAFSFYSLIPQMAAFMLMVAITILTVWAAWNYNKQVIALIGLAGAYAIPFLLGDKSSNASVLFSYIAIINIGILAVSLKKYWEPLYFTSFLLTWLIYYSWYKSKGQPSGEFDLAFLFLGIFFVLFYLTFLAYNVSKKRNFDLPDIVLILGNSFVFYGIGYSILKSQADLEWLLGLFTILNAVIHFAVGLVVYRQQNTDKNLFYFLQGLVLVFITIAIPVQLDGIWITMCWAVEAAVLFWIGRTKNTLSYEILSFPLMVLTFFSLVHDWSVGYFHIDTIHNFVSLIPLWNIYFLNSLLVVASFGFMHQINQNNKYKSPLTNQDDLLSLMSYVIRIVLLFTLYFSFRNEIACYWDQKYVGSMQKIAEQGREFFSIYYNADLPKFKTVWLLNYSLFFFSVLSLVNIKRIKSNQLALVNLFLSTFVVTLFLFRGLFLLGGLRESYLSTDTIKYFEHGVFNIQIRYISLVFLAGCLYSCYFYTKQKFLKTDLRMHFDLMLYTTVVWVLSSELIHWMNMAGSSQSYKLGLSILWGVCALLIVSLGIWKKKKYLRIGAIALFAVTLLKLFFYDLTNLDTISKTIVFVSLGTLLLIISFIYNKFKDIISD